MMSLHRPHVQFMVMARNFVRKLPLFFFILMGTVFTMSCYSSHVSCRPDSIQDPLLPNTCMGIVPSPWTQGVNSLKISTMLSDLTVVQIYVEQTELTNTEGTRITKNIVSIVYSLTSKRTIKFQVDGTVVDGKYNKLTSYVKYDDTNHPEIIMTTILSNRLVEVVEHLSELYAFVKQYPNEQNNLSVDLAAKINDLITIPTWDQYIKT